MPEVPAIAVLVLYVCMVLVRAAVLRRQGVSVLVFGRTDKRDFLIVPAVILVVYQLLAYAFSLPRVFGGLFVNTPLYSAVALRWLGVALEAAGAAFFLAALISFGRSFRVGVDESDPDALMTSGIFAMSRNPLYLAFLALFFGLFLVFPTIWQLIVLALFFSLLHRQILIEEKFLRAHYGSDYEDYCARVGRYVGRL